MDVSNNKSTNCNSTFARQLLFGLLRWIGIAEVAVKVLVQYFGRLFAKVATLATRIKETRPQYHHRLARGLLQLHLNGAELFVDDLYHAFNLFWGDWSVEKK